MRADSSLQPDAARRADTLAWLLKAEGDLRAVTVDLGADPPLVDDALFHCQQAVEKALKGSLTWHDVPFRETHSLEELGRQVAALRGELRNLADRVSLPSEYAWKFRYPGEVDSPSLAEATDALALARDRTQPSSLLSGSVSSERARAGLVIRAS